jgi:hypothetical protein
VMSLTCRRSTWADSDPGVVFRLQTERISAARRSSVTKGDIAHIRRSGCFCAPLNVVEAL